MFQIFPASLKYNLSMKTSTLLAVLLSTLGLLSLFWACTDSTQPTDCTAYIKKLEQVADSLDSIQIDTLRSTIDHFIVSDQSCSSFKANSLLSELCHELGNKLLDPPKQCTLARSYYQKANAIRRKIFKDPNHVNLLRGYTMIGSTFFEDKTKPSQRNQQLDSAWIYFELAEQKKITNASLFYRNKIEKINVLHEKEEWYPSFNILNSLYLHTKSDTNKTVANDNLPQILNLLSTTYYKTHQIESAIDFAEKAEKVSPLGSPYLKNIYWSLSNAWQGQMALNQLKGRTRAFEKTRDYSEKAIAAYYQEAIRDYEAIVNLYGNLGEGLRLAGFHESAIDTLNRGLDLHSQFKVQKPNLVAQLRINLGETHYNIGNYDAALKNYHLALKALAPSNASLDKLPAVKTLNGNANRRLLLLSDIPQALLERYRIKKDARDLSQAVAYYDSLFALINLLRGEYSNDQAKLDLAATSNEWVHKAFKVNMQLYTYVSTEEKQLYLEKAFKITEQFKAFALLETARLRNASHSLSPALQAQEKELIENIRKADSPAKRENADRAKRAYLRRLEKKEPAYFALKYQGPQLTLKEVGQQLPKDQAMLSFFCQDSALYSFFVSSQGEASIDSVQIGQKELSDQVQHFIALLTKPTGIDGRIDPQKDRAFLQQSHQLYNLLLGKKWDHKLPKRLIIIPDDVLNRLPFEALLKHKSDKTLTEQVKAGNFLISDHSISYCFSASMLSEMQKPTQSKSLQNKLAVFVPAEQELDAQREVESIEQTSRIPVKKYSQEQSTKDNFWDACQKYAFVHITTHGSLGADPDSSFIQFTPSADQDRQGASLFLKDLYSRELNQDLIAFSACETATGPYRSGEGNISLARGLAYAGVRSILSTLWKVKTDGKASILPIFYQHLNSMPKDVAMAEAKRAYFTQGGNLYPENWAGFVMIGACSAQERITPAWLWIIAGVAALSLLLFFLRSYFYK